MLGVTVAAMPPRFHPSADDTMGRVRLSVEHGRFVVHVGKAAHV